jgi:putative transcriptional regulator
MIKNKIAYWRSKRNDGKGISRAHLARQIGVGRSFVTKLEKGNATPGAELMFRVARYFGQPLEAIFQQIDDKKVTQAILCSKVIPFSQSFEANCVLACSKPSHIPFPDARPSAPVNQTTRRKSTNESKGKSQ